MSRQTNDNLVRELSQNNCFPEIENLVSPEQPNTPTMLELQNSEKPTINPIMRKLFETAQKLANLKEALEPFQQEVDKYNTKIEKVQQEQAQYEEELAKANKIINN